MDLEPDPTISNPWQAAFDRIVGFCMHACMYVLDMITYGNSATCILSNRVLVLTLQERKNDVR